MAAGVVMLAACNAAKVERGAEVTRFAGEMKAREAAAGIMPGAVLSMKECEEIALKSSLSLSVARLRYRLQDDNVRLALATGLPTAKVYYSNQMRSNPNTVNQGGMTFPVDNQQSQMVSVNATVPVLDFATTYYAWQIAKDHRRQEALVLRRSEQQLRRDVRVAYARHASELRQLVLEGMNVKAATEVLRVAESLQREGLATTAETAVVKAALAEAEVELANGKQRAAETKLGLAQLMSLSPLTTFEVDAKLPELPAVPEAAGLRADEDHALRVRPELLGQDLERHISANDVRKEIAGFLPKLDGIGSYNWSSNPFMGNPAYFLGGFQVAQSLLEGGTRIWKVDQAKLTEKVEKERTLLLSLAVLYEVELRAIQLWQGKQTIGALEAQRAARKVAFDRVLSLYKEGLEGEAATAKALVELSLDTTAVDRAQTDYLVAWYEYETAVLPGEEGEKKSDKK